jgi:hypothetical protein
MQQTILRLGVEACFEIFWPPRLEKAQDLAGQACAKFLA